MRSRAARWSFSEAKTRINRRFGQDNDPKDKANLDAVARVFHATEIRENLLPTPPSAEAWDTSIELIESYLRAFAHQHLSRSALYNAGKHGLALTPTDIKVQLDDGSILKVEARRSSTSKSVMTRQAALGGNR